MEDTLVSSRISPAKKDAGVAALESIGATTSQLINSAFDYVIETRQLPTVAGPVRPHRKNLGRFMCESTLNLDWSTEVRSYKDILREGKSADYEALA